MGNAHDENVSVSLTCSEYDVLDHKMERMFNAEFDDIKDQEESMSVEDRVARKMMVETTTLRTATTRLACHSNMTHRTFQTAYPPQEKD